MDYFNKSINQIGKYVKPHQEEEKQKIYVQVSKQSSKNKNIIDTDYIINHKKQNEQIAIYNNLKIQNICKNKFVLIIIFFIFLITVLMNHHVQSIQKKQINNDNSKNKHLQSTIQTQDNKKTNIQNKIFSQNTHITSKKSNSQSNKQTVEQQNDMKNIETVNDQTQKYLQVPKQLFLFDDNSITLKLQRYMYKNIQRTANQSGFKVIKIKQNNLQPYLSKNSIAKISNLILKLKQKFNVNKLQSIPSKYKKAFYLLVQIMNLYDNGGIMISNYICLTQNFNWIKNITNNIHVRRGIDSVTPQVFAFFSLQNSSELQKVNIRAKYQIQKKVRLFPGLLPIILVSIKESKYLNNIIQQIIYILSSPNQKQAIKGGFNYYGLNQNNIIQNIFQFSSHRIIQKKHQQINNIFFSSNQSKLAIDYYGLYFMSSYAGPKKIQRVFSVQRIKGYFQYLSRLPIDQLYNYVGKFYVGVVIYPIAQCDKILTNYMKKDSKLKVIRGSFLQKMLFPSGQQYFLIDNKQYREAPTNKTWDKLPKIIWLIQVKGEEKLPLSNQFCIQQIKKVGKQSGFKVNVVTQQNLDTFLSKQIIKQIYEIKQKSKIQLFKIALSNIIRMILLRQYGGIYMDSSVIALQNFNWVVNITNYPSQYIFNRYGETPQVLMQYHPLFGLNYTWSYNQKHNTKQQWQLSYQNNFIAAVKGSKLSIDWIQTYKKILQLPSYKQIQQIFNQCQMGYRWDLVYLIDMDSLKCAIGLKNKELNNNKYIKQENVLDYYKVWSLNGYNGFQKNRQNFGVQTKNLDGVINNLVFAYSIEYMQDYIGPMFQVTKIYGWVNQHLNKLFKQTLFDNRKDLIHPESLMAKYLGLFDKKLILIDKDQYTIAK